MHTDLIALILTWHLYTLLVLRASTSPVCGHLVTRPFASPCATMQSFTRSAKYVPASTGIRHGHSRLQGPARPVQPVQKRADGTQLRTNVGATASGAAAVAEPESFKWGAKMKPLGISVALGVALWFVPAPQGVTTQAWHLLAIFVSTIAGIITQPLPLGAVALMGLGASMITKTLTFDQAFSAFSSQIPCAPADCLLGCAMRSAQRSTGQTGPRHGSNVRAARKCIACAWRR